MAARITFIILTLLLSGQFLQGCSAMKKKAVDDAATEQQIYRRATTALRTNNFEVAIQNLRLLESRFPFGRYAEQAQLELIYAHYMARQMEAARHTADRFIRLHPQHPNVDYAFYMKGMAAFHQDRAILDRFRRTRPSQRDTTSALTAFNDFSLLLQRHPNSPYAPDARQRMIYLRNLLAEAEVNVANFYMSAGAYVAAANRARNVVLHYSQTEVTDQAIAILIEANWRLGLEEAARTGILLMAENFPDHPGFMPDGSFEFRYAVRNRDRSWINMLTLGLLDRPDVPPPLRIRVQDESAAT